MADIEGSFPDQRDSRAIYYHIGDLDYVLGTGSNTPKIQMRLEGITLSQEGCYVSFGGGRMRVNNETMFLTLDRRAFRRHTGLDWDCTPQGVETLKKDLIGKTFELDLGIRVKEPVASG